LFFVWQGSIQNFKPPVTAQTLEGSPQTIEQGPLASQLSIKMLGTNGGGYFNANSAHPYENPTPFSNLIQMLLIFVLGAGLTYMFGKMVRDTRQGWALFAAMSAMFLAGAFVCYWAEQRDDCAFCNGHNRCQLRSGHRHARQLHADRRARSPL
jgi:K+-transporting ATPase ATPase A chain